MAVGGPAREQKLRACPVVARTFFAGHRRVKKQRRDRGGPRDHDDEDEDVGSRFPRTSQRLPTSLPAGLVTAPAAVDIDDAYSMSHGSSPQGEGA